MRLLRIFNDTRSRRSRMDARRAARSRQPLMEEVEARTLLSATPLMYMDPLIVHDTPGQVAPASFTVHLTSQSDHVVYAQYKTVDHSATAGKDYIESSGWVAFTPGQTTQVITTTLLGGGSAGTTALYGVQLSNATNARIVTPEADATIVYNTTAAPPALSINSVEMYRGLGGTKSAVFDVSLNTPQSSPVTFTASTSNLTAMAGVDYQATTQTLTIQPGQKSAQFVVNVYGTSVPTATKAFVVHLLNASMAGTSVPLTNPLATGALDYGA